MAYKMYINGRLYRITKGTTTYKKGTATLNGVVYDIDNRLDCTVTFMSEGSLYTTATALEDECVTLPEDPTKTGGYTFSTWHLGSEDGDVVDLTNYPLTTDITVYASFKRNPAHTLYLKNNYGTPKTGSFTIYEGQLVQEVIDEALASDEFDLSSDNYDFENWYNESTWETLFDNTSVCGDSDVFLYAKWTLNVSTDYIIFNDMSSQVISAGSSVEGTSLNGFYDFTIHGGYSSQITTGSVTFNSTKVTKCYTTSGASSLDSRTIEFTLTKARKITVVYKTQSSSYARGVVIFDSSGNTVWTSSTSTSLTQVTTDDYLEPGTYQIGGTAGIRIYIIEI